MAAVVGAIHESPFCITMRYILETVEIIFPDEKKQNFPKGIKAIEILEKLKLKKKFLVAKINGELVDLSAPIENDSRIEFLDFSSKEGKEVYWHSTSHVMAQAVTLSFSEKVELAIGPAIENGFYYDFYREEPFTPEDLITIEKKMDEIIKADYPFTRELKNFIRDESISIPPEYGKFKSEMITEAIKRGDEISFYHNGDFEDFCRGPHIPSTGKIGAFKLLSIAGAYWHGNEKNPMLQRIYGISFPDKKELDAYLFQIEEAKKRDHRKLGRELKLFSLLEEIGPGLVLYHPNGALLRNIIEDFEKKEHYRRGYQQVIGPQILRSDIWKTSGHYGYYKDFMYFTQVDEQEYGIKPMNCPGHILIYQSEIRSYRDLPLRYFELGTVHRHEKAGVLHGLMRVRAFTQDDAHIFCRQDQVLDEIKGVIDFVHFILKVFGFKEFEMEISTKPEKYIGKDEDWEYATNALKRALEDKGLPYRINEGDGAFYGPKIDVKLKDALNRTWQCATIQVDFALPQRFQLKYIGSDGKESQPVMIHRVVLGSIDRFLGVLIEHYGAAFPLWLSPTQIKILPIAERHLKYAGEVKEEFLRNDFRAELDLRDATIGNKIREAQLEKVPYMIILGDKEVEKTCISVRERKQGDLGQMDKEKFMKLLRERLDKKE